MELDPENEFKTLEEMKGKLKRHFSYIDDRDDDGTRAIMAYQTYIEAVRTQMELLKTGKGKGHNPAF